MGANGSKSATVAPLPATIEAAHSNSHPHRATAALLSDCQQYVEHWTCPDTGCRYRHSDALACYEKLRSEHPQQFPPIALCNSVDCRGDCTFKHDAATHGDPAEVPFKVLAVWDTENVSPMTSGGASPSEVAQALVQLLTLTAGVSTASVELLAVYAGNSLPLAVQKSLKLGGVRVVYAGEKRGAADTTIKDVINDRLVEVLKGQRDAERLQGRRLQAQLRARQKAGRPDPVAVAGHAAPQPDHGDLTNTSHGIAIISGDTDFSADLRRARSCGVWTGVVHGAAKPNQAHAHDLATLANVWLPWDTVLQLANVMHRRTVGSSGNAGNSSGHQGSMSGRTPSVSFAPADGPLTVPELALDAGTADNAGSAAPGLGEGQPETGAGHGITRSSTPSRAVAAGTRPQGHQDSCGDVGVLAGQAGLGTTSNGASGKKARSRSRGRRASRGDVGQGPASGAGQGRGQGRPDTHSSGAEGGPTGQTQSAGQQATGPVSPPQQSSRSKSRSRSRPRQGSREAKRCPHIQQRGVCKKGERCFDYHACPDYDEGGEAACAARRAECLLFHGERWPGRPLGSGVGSTTMKLPPQGAEAAQTVSHGEPAIDAASGDRHDAPGRPVDPASPARSYAMAVCGAPVEGQGGSHAQAGAPAVSAIVGLPPPKVLSEALHALDASLEGVAAAAATAPAAALASSSSGCAGPV